MSLFRAREFWSVNLNCTEGFGSTSLLIESVNARPVIFLGSLDGYLRAYTLSGSEPSEYKPSDLLYETLFSTPVLQMGMGNLVSGSPGRHLAILHPKTLAVYNVKHSDTEGETLSLRHVYQHTLPRAAHSFVLGTFGRVTNRDFLCVQSLDGLLSFFEQESTTFQAQLPDFLLPGPFKYLDTTDAFIFQDANHYLKCYGYEELSQGGVKVPKSLWTHNIGNFIIDITVMKVGEELQILILTERSFYCLNQQGQIIVIKMFEFSPIFFFNFLNTVSNNVMTLIFTEYQVVNVYEGTCMKWSAKLDFLPVCASIINLNNLHGLLVLLSDSGMLQCVYLGTIPSLYLIPPCAESEINVFEAEEELKRLQLQITDTEMAKHMDDVLTVKLIVGQKETTHCNVSVELKTLSPVNNVQITFKVQPPLVSSIVSTVVASVVDSEQIVAKISVEGKEVVSVLEVLAIVSYILPNGSPRVVENTGTLPFEIAMVGCPAAKDALVKLTIATNKPTLPLNELFKNDEGTPNAVGLKFVNSESVITIIAAKTSQRYRIQGESLEDLTLVVSTLVERLNLHFRRLGDLSLNFGGPLPVQDFFSLIEKHFELITRKRLKQEKLSQRAMQYRTIQKKVLASLKDLNPKPNGALYKVLDDTYNMMREVIADLETLQEELQGSLCRLSAVNSLFLTLMQLMTLTKSDLENLKLAFNPIIYDGEEQGWLEVQNATLSLLLRTVFAKSTKDQNKPSELTLEPLSDVSRFCKLFSTVVDRATKGASLMERAEFDAHRESLPTVPSMKEWGIKEVKLLPRGTKLMDLTLPVTQKPVTLQKQGTEISEEQRANQVNYVEVEATIETTPDFDEVPRETEVESPAFGKQPVVVKKTEESHLAPTLMKKMEQETKVELSLVDDEDTIWDINIDEIKI